MKYSYFTDCENISNYPIRLPIQFPLLSARPFPVGKPRKNIEIEEKGQNEGKAENFVPFTQRREENEKFEIKNAKKADFERVKRV